MTPEIIDTPMGPPDLPHIRTMQSNTLHRLARVTHLLLGCKNPRPLEPQLSGKENSDSGCGNESPTTSPAAADKKDYVTKKRPSRVAKKSFKKKAKATNSNSNEFELGPKAADTSHSDVIHHGRSSLAGGAATTTTTNNDAAAAKLLFTHRYNSNECVMCFNANLNVANSSYSLSMTLTRTMMTSSTAVSIKKVSSKKKSAITPVTNSPVMIKMDNSKPIRKPNARKVSDNTNYPLGMSETTLPYTLSPQKTTSRVSKRAKKICTIQFSNCEPVDEDNDDHKLPMRQEVPCASPPMDEDDDDLKLPAKREVSWEEEKEEDEVIDRGSLVGLQNDGLDRDSLVSCASHPTMTFIPSPYIPLSPLSSPSTSDDIEGGVPYASPLDIIYYLDREHSDEELGVFRLLQPGMKTENLELWIYSKITDLMSMATSPPREEFSKIKSLLMKLNKTTVISKINLLMRFA